MNKYQNFDDLDHIWDELCAYYQGNAARALIWLSTKNAALNDRTPFELIRDHKERELLDFVLNVMNGRMQ